MKSRFDRKPRSAGGRGRTHNETMMDSRWTSVVERDKAADGTFWYSVATTGVFCRPSCPSRLANPKNVAFHASPEAARRAGYRACLRCRPEGVSLEAERITKACRILDAAGEPPTLAALAAEVDLSPYHFHRLFKRITGVTPRAYAAERRASRVRSELAAAPSVTEAIYAAGFSSSSRFYETATSRLGMTPTAYRAGGAKELLLFAIAACSLGELLVASSAKGVAAILLGEQATERALQAQFPKARLVGGDAAYEQLVARVIAFVESPREGLDLPLDVRGTAFQQRVWQALRDVPAGKTSSYAELATKIGAPEAVRAVASALAANKLAVAIPCHRVIKADGSLSGYRWGVERKRKLLAHEGRS